MPDKRQIEELFDNISPHYDFLNHFMSLGIDKIWRKRVANFIAQQKPRKVLDIATGTGDLAFAISKRCDSQITGIDLSEKMLEIAKDKSKGHNNVSFQKADSEQLPFEDESLDAVTVAFGVRNFSDPQKGLNEIFRVLRKNGTAAILEFSYPQRTPIKQCYGLYFNHILPKIGKLVSKNDYAYSYLPESVHHFPQGDTFLAMMQDAGFVETQAQLFHGGIASFYIGWKR